MRKLPILLCIFVLRTCEIEAREIGMVETPPELQNEIIKRNGTLLDADSNSSSGFRPAVITTETDADSSSQIFKCQGSHVDSLTLIPCASVSECDHRISCLDQRARCDPMESLISGRMIYGSKCGEVFTPGDDDSSVSGDSWDSCFSVSFKKPWYSDFGSVVECTSSHFQKTLFYSFYQKHGKMLYTLDSPSLLMNLTTLKPRNQNGFEGEDSLFTLKHEEGKGSETELASVWADAEIGVSCDLFPFFFDMDTFVVYLTRANGRRTKVEKSGINNQNRGLSLPYSGISRIRRFRIPVDVTSISCAAALDLEDRRIITKSLNISVIVPPRNLTVPSLNSPNGSERLPTNQKLGCNFTGSERNMSDYREMLKNLTSHLRRNVIQSTVHFFVLMNRVGDNFGCAPLPNPNYTNTSTPSVIKGPFHFLLHFDAHPPLINKTVQSQSGNFRGDSVVTSAGVSAGVLNVDASAVDFPVLICRFSGDPSPQVTWMKNGQDLYLTSGEAEQRAEISYFNLRSEISSDRKTKFQANFTCVVQNYLGRDTLEFRVVSIPKHTIQIHEEIPKLTSLLSSISRTLDKIDKQQGNSTEKSESTKGISIILLLIIFLMNLTIFLCYCINNWNWNCKTPRAQHFTAILTRQKRRLWKRNLFKICGSGKSLSTAQLELETQNCESPIF